MKWIKASSFALGVALIVLAAPDPDNPPFVYEGVYSQPWGPAGATWPEQLFWEYTDTSKYPESRTSADGVAGSGAVPILGAVAWGYEYGAGRPGGDRDTVPGFKQFGEWIDARGDLLPMLADGSTWGGSSPSGYISPAMPLDSADWPAGVDNAVWSDWVAAKLGELCRTVNLRGWFAADYVEGIPHNTTATLDFNPRILSVFETWSGITVPGASVSERSSYITDNPEVFRTWTDFWCESFAYWYAALGREITRLTGEPSLMCAQTHMDPARRRVMGTDYRIYLRYLPASEWYFNVELQSDGLRNVPAYGVTSVKMGQFACREPSMPLGGHMDADHSEFWAAVGNTKGSLSADDQAEWGAKYLKHHWLTVGWAHVANRDGTVRRAPQAFLRHYWDAGGVDSTLTRVMREEIPRYPFGPAMYYSVPVERKFEKPNSQWNTTDESNAVNTIYATNSCGYYVSDAALDSLQATSYPTSWIVFDEDSLPAEERTRLTSIAPINTVSPNGPVSFSAGVAGFGFVNQSAKVVVAATNTTDSPVTAQVSFNDVVDGTYTVTDLLDPQTTYSLTISSGQGTVSIPIERWDTRALGIAGLNGTGVTPDGNGGWNVRSQARISVRNSRKGAFPVIAYTVPTRSAVRLEIYSMKGLKVGTLVDRTLDAGSYTARASFRGIPAGSYIVRIHTNGIRVSQAVTAGL